MLCSERSRESPRERCWDGASDSLGCSCCPLEIHFEAPMGGCCQEANDRHRSLQIQGDRSTMNITKLHKAAVIVPNCLLLFLGPTSRVAILSSITLYYKNEPWPGREAKCLISRPGTPLDSLGLAADGTLVVSPLTDYGEEGVEGLCLGRTFASVAQQASLSRPLGEPQQGQGVTGSFDTFAQSGK